MTYQELSHHFNTTFGFGDWPKTFEVDHETYANICHNIFKHVWPRERPSDSLIILEISVGKNYGIMFKNVELILKGK